LSTYNQPSEATLDRSSIAAIYRVDMIVPPEPPPIFLDTILG